MWFAKAEEHHKFIILLVELELEKLDKFSLWGKELINNNNMNAVEENSLLKEFDLHSITNYILYFMGLSIENLLKAIFLMENYIKWIEIEDKGTLREELKTHDLEKLFSWTKIHLKDDYLLFFDLYKASIDKRYPIATKKEYQILTYNYNIDHIFKVYLSYMKN